LLGGVDLEGGSKKCTLEKILATPMVGLVENYTRCVRLFKTHLCD